MNQILHAVTILFLAVAGAADEPRQTHSDSQVPDMTDLDDLQPFGVASNREITTLVRQLGGKQFKDRESAQNTLESLGMIAVPTLEAARDSLTQERSAASGQLRTSATDLSQQIATTVLGRSMGSR